MSQTLAPYQYTVLRCVPRVEREEFMNVGVVLYCPEHEFLDVGWHVEEPRLRAFAPDVDVASVRAALAAVELVCAGEAHGAYAEATRATAYGVRVLGDTQSSRFGFLKAPRSTVLQPGPVHGGVTADPRVELDRLVARLVY